MAGGAHKKNPKLTKSHFQSTMKFVTSSVLLLIFSSCFWILQSTATTVWDCSNYVLCEECIGDERYSCIDNNEVTLDQCQMRVFESC